jgi:DNA mismatch repair protein MutS
MFATHYHELTELAQLLKRVQNCCVAVKEEKGQVVFLRRIVPGGADRSYGIEVARLAGLPEAVVDSARRILGELESNEQVRLGHRLASGTLMDETPQAPRPSHPKKRTTEEPMPMQIPLFVPETTPHPLLRELAEINAESLTPLAAINMIFALREQARKELDG